MNFDRAKDHPDIGGDTTSDASVEDKEDFDDKKPMITKEVIKDKSLLGSLIGKLKMRRGLFWCKADLPRVWAKRWISMLADVAQKK